MSQSLSGSRYELHIAKKWAAETRSQDYYTIHQADRLVFRHRRHHGRYG